MKLTKITRSAVILTAMAGLAIGAAPAASAKSFTGSNGAGHWSYTDSTDRFCIQTVTNLVTVQLKPVTAGRGPSYTLHLGGDEHKCVSLATAYEDSRYHLVVTSAYTDPKGKYFYS